MKRPVRVASSNARFRCSSEVAPRVLVRGPCGSRMWERDRILEKKSINDKDETRVCVPTPLGISPVSVNLCGPPDSGAKVTCEWDQHINLTVAFVVFLFLMLVFSFVLLFTCCETDAEVSASKRCSVMGRACSVFGCRLSPLGPVGENYPSTTPPVMSLHCLNLWSVPNITLAYWHHCSRVLSAWFSWRPAGAECSGSACLSKSSVNLCSTPGLACLCAGMCVSLRYLIVL